MCFPKIYLHNSGKITNDVAPCDHGGGEQRSSTILLDISRISLNLKISEGNGVVWLFAAESKDRGGDMQVDPHSS